MAGMAGANQDGGVNFYPNDQADLAKPDPGVAAPPAPLLEDPMIRDAWIKPHDQNGADYYEQAGNLYRIFSDEQKERLAATIAGGLRHTELSVQKRMLGYLEKADPDYARRVREELE